MYYKTRLKKTLYPVIIFIIVVIFFSCEENEYYRGNDVKLEFSQDTILFDTVFTTIGSVTKRLKVYNPYNSTVKIKSVYLAKNTENFRLNINGIPQSSSENIDINGKDSLYIFAEVTVDPTNHNEPMVIQDSIVFETADNFQDVDIIAYGQDVHLINGQLLRTQTWRNDKPYLIYNSAIVNSSQKLTILRGTNLHFHKNSALMVFGTLHVRGSAEEPVVFTGDRLEFMYTDIPGQWEGIFLMPGSRDNTIDHAVIKNANYGIYVDSIPDQRTPTLTISNSRIEHHVISGLFTNNSLVEAYNCLFAHCGYYCVAVNYGGFASFYHCTIANTVWEYSNRNTPALLLKNYIVDRENEIIYTNPLYNAYFGNCIIYGVNYREIGFEKQDEAYFNYQFENCVIKLQEQGLSKDDTLNVDIHNNYYFRNNIMNPDSFKFADIQPDNSVWNYQLDTLSIAKDAGDIDIVNEKPDKLEFDLEGVSRLNDQGPDIGAFEKIYAENDSI
jgi:hypothetical protein